MGRLHTFEDGWTFREGGQMVSFYYAGVHCPEKNSTLIRSTIYPRRSLTRLCLNKTTGKTDIYETMRCMDGPVDFT